MAFAHPFEEGRFVTAIMNQNRTFYGRQQTKEFPPYFAFFGHGIRP